MTRYTITAEPEAPEGRRWTSSTVVAVGIICLITGVWLANHSGTGAPAPVSPSSSTSSAPASAAPAG